MMVQGVRALVGNVVDGIAINLLRIQLLGIPHIMVANVAPGNCMPYSTKLVNNYTACIKNDTISNETTLHNNLLEARVNVLNKGIRGADIIILNMTKAFEEIFHHGEKYGKSVFIWSTLEGRHAFDGYFSLCAHFL